MDNGVNIPETKNLKMGASSNPNATRLAALQERKKNIEDALIKRNQELRQLCVQEAELTGIIPPEIPLEPGESPPVFRRRVGTLFQLPQNLINNLNNEEESLSSLELSMQVQANMAEAALSLANESNVSKTIRRQHMAQYQYHKRQYNTLEEKLTFLKTRMHMAQQSHIPAQHMKQKKKPRPLDQDDNLSVNIQSSELFTKSLLRHSMRSLQHSVSGDSVDQRNLANHQKLAYRNSEGSPQTDLTSSLFRPEDALVSGIYRLSLNGYKTYMERKESGHIINNQHLPLHFTSSHSQSNLNLYSPQQLQSQFSQIGSHTFPHASQRSQQSTHGSMMLPRPNSSLPQSYYINENTRYLINTQCTTGLRQSNSPSSINNLNNYAKVPYYPPTMYTNCKPYSVMEQQIRTLNPHQIQPHQQYEHDFMASAGLGGYWKRTESGEFVWCSSASNDSWQRDKRFGSLDRRRNKRIHKKASPLVDPKSATISVVMQSPESVRPISSKMQHMGNRNVQDNKQLTRTQSLGSVGAQTVDSVWPSDDNSSCGSDAHSINEVNITARKQKQKEWFETLLDGPAASTPTRTHSTTSATTTPTIPSISPEEKYVETLPYIVCSSSPHKPPLEIPAESNPSSTVQEPKMELFNNNIPKHGTLIQAGHCKPYHEETKPFEMSDFYKYSTKFKKSTNKQPETKCQPDDSSLPLFVSTSSVHHNINQCFEEDNASVIQKGIYQPLQPMKCQPLSPNNNFDRNVESVSNQNSIDASFDLHQFTSNVAENFSAEMNAWYQNHEQQVENHNTKRQTAGNRSTATLV